MVGVQLATGQLPEVSTVGVHHVDYRVVKPVREHDPAAVRRPGRLMVIDRVVAKSMHAAAGWAHRGQA